MYLDNGAAILFFKILGLPYGSTVEWMLGVSNGRAKS